MRRFVLSLSFATLFFAAIAPAEAQQKPDANDVARFLAGLPVRAESPLSARSTEPGWQQHSKAFDTAFTTFEREKRSKIRKWSSEHLQQHASVVHYMFSGPDFLHADAFFPAAST